MTSAGWRPSLGAWRDGDRTRVRVWAPAASHVDLIVESGTRPAAHRLQVEPDGYHSGAFDTLAAGSRYWYALDNGPALPDPASRFQPEGVHGPSEVVDAAAFPWRSTTWAAPRADSMVVYELHVGTFSPEGTFAAAMHRLDHLVDLGVTAVELMPVADFPGGRNWGYDGVALFAPARCYGRPDDLRRLVDRAHLLGLAVILDVVYNHLGPDGNYLSSFSPAYFTNRHRTPWGAAVNLDQAGSEHVRRFLIENAAHWINEYRFDGLRLDATHALIDDSPRHVVAELTAAVRASAAPRTVWLSAEDHRNDAAMVRGIGAGGWGLDAVWADDLHHQLRSATAGDRDGYYADFDGTTGDIVATIRQGWFYTGQASAWTGGPRGTDPAGIPPERFVVCLQNHDQVGNRALGERLHHQIDPAVWRAVSALLLMAPETPLLFMGQEWAAGTPFLYFTDHGPELGRLVTEGRRREFRHFPAFADPECAASIPDPQADRTFERSRLDWSEPSREPYRGVLQMYTDWLALRRELAPDGPGEVRAVALGPAALAIGRRQRHGEPVWVVARLRGAGRVELPLDTAAQPLHVRLSTEAREYVTDPAPVSLERGELRFSRPGAVALSTG